jgi:radical SAM protein with 4Fe4S-binding SPASM domain
MMTSVKGYIRKLFDPSRGETPAPALRRLGIDIVHGCQLRCIGCPNSTLHPKISFMSPADFDAILDNIDVEAINHLLLFNFGEPLLHTALPDILERIKKRTSPSIRTIGISTNGQHHDFPMIAEMLKVGILNMFAVSCDGNGTKEEYERLRPPGKYEKLIEFLVKVKELRDKYSPQTYLATSTICETNEGKKRWEETLTPLGWTPVFRDWYHLPGSVRSQAGENPVTRRKGCRFMNGEYLFVDADSTVVPCCVHPKPFELGSLKTQRYSHILKGDQRRKKLHELRTSKRTMPICGDCEY